MDELRHVIVIFSSVYTLQNNNNNNNNNNQVTSEGMFELIFDAFIFQMLPNA